VGEALGPLPTVERDFPVLHLLALLHAIEEVRGLEEGFEQEADPAGEPWSLVEGAKPRLVQGEVPIDLVLGQRPAMHALAEALDEPPRPLRVRPVRGDELAQE